MLLIKLIIRARKKGYYQGKTIPLPQSQNPLESHHITDNLLVIFVRLFWYHRIE